MVTYSRSSGGYYYKILASGNKVRVSKDEYLKNHKSKAKYSKSKASKSPKKRAGTGYTKDACRELLTDKISLNMGEFSEGKWKNRKQALAVSYSQINTQHPKCKRFFPKPN
jgi:hypothetical protein